MQTQPPAAQSRTASREVRRRQLIEATIDSIAQHGFSGTTMATVTGIAGLSMGIVSFHFKSKHNLLTETLMFLAEVNRALWHRNMHSADPTPAARMRAMIGAHFHPDICTRRKLAVWFAFFGEARYRKAYREKLTWVDTERVRETERLCRELVRDGGYRQVDPMVVTKSLEGMFDGLWLNILMYPEIYSPAAAHDQILAYLAATFPRHFDPLAR